MYHHVLVFFLHLKLKEEEEEDEEEEDIYFLALVYYSINHGKVRNSTIGDMTDALMDLIYLNFNYLTKVL